MLKPRSRRSSATLPAAPGSAGAQPQAQPGNLDLVAAIGRGLKALFDDVAALPVPDKLRQLLDELERKSNAPSGKS